MYSHFQHNTTQYRQHAQLERQCKQNERQCNATAMHATTGRNTIQRMT